MGSFPTISDTTVMKHIFGGSSHKQLNLFFIHTFKSLNKIQRIIRTEYQLIVKKREKQV
jgi:hypothetical protein